MQTTSRAHGRAWIETVTDDARATDWARAHGRAWIETTCRTAAQRGRSRPHGRVN